jgi:hypothetical protein
MAEQEVPTINSVLLSIIGNYQRNIQMYNENMSHVLGLITSMQTQTIFSGATFEFINPNLPDDNTLHQGAEITEYLNIFTYVQSPSEERHICPISLEEMIDGEELSMIRACGHIFKKNSIMIWLSRNRLCPVCRCDIRSFITQN